MAWRGAAREECVMGGFCPVHGSVTVDNGCRIGAVLHIGLGLRLREMSFVFSRSFPMSERYCCFLANMALRLLLPLRGVSAGFAVRLRTDRSEQKHLCRVVAPGTIARLFET